MSAAELDTVVQIPRDFDLKKAARLWGGATYEVSPEDGLARVWVAGEKRLIDGIPTKTFRRPRGSILIPSLTRDGRIVDPSVREMLIAHARDLGCEHVREGIGAWRSPEGVVVEKITVTWTRDEGIPADAFEGFAREVAAECDQIAVAFQRPDKPSLWIVQRELSCLSTTTPKTTLVQ